MTTESNTTTSTPSNFRYRDENGKMISKDEAIKRRWAHKEDGNPTKIYLHRMAIREAEKNGDPRPIREKKSYEAGSQSHNDIPSPYDLERRSGYRVIWQVLAENVNEFVTSEDLHAEVNRRLSQEAPEWYQDRYMDEPYNVEQNANVMTRAPYNKVLESMQQRVVNENNSFKLMINVTEPRQLKKRGRKPKIKAVTPDATIENDNDNATEVEIQEANAITA